MAIRAASYAKVNLFLRVLNRRPDGFHNIETVVQTISLHDILSFDLADAGVEVTVSGPAKEGVPEGDANLCSKAATALFRELDLQRGVRINLKKMVPAGAGLGGGSSNAACTLLGLNHLLSLGLSPCELSRIGARVGSDVPALVLGGTVLVGGRGERVERLENAPPLHLLILKPDFQCPADRVYKEWDKVGTTGSQKARKVLSDLEKEDYAALRKIELNDLEAAARSLYPQLAELKAMLLNAGAKVAFLCGSGSAVMGVYGSQEERDAAWFELRAPGREVFHAESVHEGAVFAFEQR